MSTLSTNANDRVVAQAYRAYAQGATFKLHAMHPEYTPAETAIYEDLDDITLDGVASVAQPTIGAPVASTIPGVGVVWSLPIRGWSIHNGTAEDVAVEGLVITDEDAELVLYLREFDIPVNLLAGESVAFDVDLWFDTVRSLV